MVTYLKSRANKSHLYGYKLETCISRYKGYKENPNIKIKYVDNIIEKNKDALVFDLSGNEVSYKSQ